MKTRISEPCVLALLAVALMGGCRQESENPKSGVQLRLEVSQAADDSKAFQGSRVYVGVLVNAGMKTATVEGMEMPGGYGGSGQFFPCALYEHSHTGERRLLRREERPFTKQIFTRDIAPGQRLEVCRMVLPLQATPAAHGSCVFFSMHTRWESNGTSEQIDSEPFVISPTSSISKCPTDSP